MSVTLPRLVLMAFVLSPSLSWALGLGEIHLQSSLNEPMRAEIDLLAAAPDELTALRASLAPREAFTRYGIDRPPFLTTLSFKVGKSKEGRDVLQVTSADSIPEPFVTFLVEVNWARGRLMREYTVLLDPPVYTPGERANSSAPVSAATSTAPAQVPSRAAAPPVAATRRSPSSASSSAPAASANASGGAVDASNYRVAQGDSLMKIVRSMRAGSPTDIDQTMIAVYRANPDAFGGNINILKRGAVLRIPGADEVAALNQTEAMSEVRRQMSAWRSGSGAESTGHLRLVTPGAGSGTGSGAGGSESAATATAETQALRTRVKDLESQLTEQKRLLDVRNNELADLQHKLGTPVPAPLPGSKPTAPVATPAPKPPVAAAPPASTPAPPASTPAPTPTPVPPPADTAAPAASAPVETAPLPVPVKPAPPASASDSGSWIDWVAANWWLPAAVILALIVGLALVAWRKRQQQAAFPAYDTDDSVDLAGRGARRDDSFVVEESGEHHRLPPELVSGSEPFAETTSDLKGPSEDTMSSESAVNLDQGDPLAEADFHMAYGLYDQAADLVRIALEREPDRRDLRMKLLEIYFVWGNKEQFLQTAKTLETTRDRAPAGEWDKIVIMGKQIAPDEPMFQAVGGGRGAGALVDLNLEGGENRVDIDLFGEPEGEHGDTPTVQGGDSGDTGESPRLHARDADLDFTLDAPERGADDAPTREMPRRGDEPTVESELMSFHDAPTQESPTLANPTVRDRFANLPPKIDQTAEVSIDDLGLDLESLENSDQALSHSHLAETDHPADAPTMVAGLDERSRSLMAAAESRSRDQDLTELERELEASFVADLGPDANDRTEVLGPESGPTVQMPRGQEVDTSSTSRFTSPEFSDIHEIERPDVDSTSRLRGLDANSIDLDLDRLASQLGQGDTVEQPRSDDDIFSAEVFDATTRSKGVDLDVGDVFDEPSQEPTNKLKAVNPNATSRLASEESLPELEPVTMSEVGTKLDLARAYMDMGDPEGARSILEEVVNEGSASQKQEAQRLIEALPG